jgi:CRISPR-associated protein Cas2
MVVFILERVSPALRGELSRWLLEPRAGVFVGQVSALVRDKLWQKVVDWCESPKAWEQDRPPGALMIFRARTEQGFSVRSFGDPTRRLVDYEGLTLVRIPGAAPGSRRRGTPRRPKEEASPVENPPGE